MRDWLANNGQSLQLAVAQRQVKGRHFSMATGNGAGLGVGWAVERGVGPWGLPMRYIIQVRYWVVLAAFASWFLTGCDAWFWRRFDITPTDAGGLHVASLKEADVVASIREYTEQEKLPCGTSASHPIDCFRIPIRVWAISVENGFVVCYGAGGRKRKFEHRMDGP
jgi:hypothetical protein